MSTIRTRWEALSGYLTESQIEHCIRVETEAANKAKEFKEAEEAAAKAKAEAEEAKELAAVEKVLAIRQQEFDDFLAKEEDKLKKAAALQIEWEICPIIWGCFTDRVCFTDALPEPEAEGSLNS